MVKVFTPNKDGKIEFTKKELENLLNEVWRDGYNSNTNYTWRSPWWYGNGYSYVSCTDSTSSASTVTIPSSDNITLTADHATLSSNDIATNSITIKTGE
jgi:hypothetical protein